MPTIRPPRGIGFNLALRLYVLLVAVIVPTLTVYYVHNSRTIETLHAQEIDQMARMVSSRLEDWVLAYDFLADIRSQDRDALHEELKKLTSVTTTVENSSFFFTLPGGTLSFAAASDARMPTEPSERDLQAVSTRQMQTVLVEIPPVPGYPPTPGRILFDVSVPIVERDEIRGVVHLRIASRPAAELAAGDATARLGQWLSGLRDRKRETLNLGLRRIVEEPGGIESIAVFLGSGGGLDFVTSYGPYAPNRPIDQDLIAMRERKIQKIDVLRGEKQVPVISLAIPFPEKAEPRGLIHMQVLPARLGLGQWLPQLGASLVYGAVAMILVVGIGVAFFFHFAVRRPIRDLMESMAQVTGGNLGAVVETARTGEFGWLASSYNHMMRRLKSSVDENHRLLEQIKGFNEELRRKIEAATRELAGKNEQLQVVNEKLFAVQRQMATQEKLATLGQVATIIAHELGTPLNAISGHLQLLLQDPVTDAPTLERLKVIDSQVDRLTAIVREVLKAMRVPAPRLDQVNVGAAIRGAADLVAPVAGKRGITLDVRIHNDVPMIYADSGQIEQVLMNLFTNSMDAMTAGGKLTVESAPTTPEELARVSKELSVNLDGAGYVRIGVSDTGTGMDEETALHAFEPFYTTKRLESEGGGGLGLGLSICRQIIKNHHGEITVRSRKGKGTEFDIYLPIERRKGISQ